MILAQVRVQTEEVVKKKGVSGGGLDSGCNLKTEPKELLINCTWGVRDRGARMTPLILS